MVATRRGVRVSSPAKTDPEQRSEVQVRVRGRLLEVADVQVSPGGPGSEL